MYFRCVLQDEIVAVSEKAVLRVTDLLDWIASPKEIQWDRGLKGICEADCEPLPKDKSSKDNHQYDKGLNAKFSPGHSEFLADVRQEKEAIGDVPDLNDSAVVIINSSQYSRYRAVLRRIQGAEKYWMHNSLIVSLGGFTTPTRKTHILFCREIFDYAELEEHPYLCNHLAPKLKGRPRKRKKVKRPGSPESESASSESSTSTSVSLSATSTKVHLRLDNVKVSLSLLSFSPRMALRRIYCRSSAKRIPKRKRNSSKNSFLSWNVETRRSKDLLCWDTNKVRFIYVINYSESRFILFLQLICIYSLKKYRKWEDTMVV